MSPLSRAVVLQPQGAQIAVVGLGAGAIAYYARQGQTVRFYEIDPIIEPLARKWFTFLRDATATVEVVLGDARLTLRDTPDRSLDLLFLDAFSSDAIPVHLLTVEAVQLYLAKLKPDRFLLLHVSNRHLDLKRVLRAIARRLGLTAAFIRHAPGTDWAATVEAIALAPSRAPLDKLLDRGWQPLADGPEVLWTDDRSNLLSVISW
jgi:spermidine synthase